MFTLFRPLIFKLPAELAHRATVTALRFMPPLPQAAPDPMLATRVAGLDFPNPVGLAAGFDKDAEVPLAMLRLGFGFVEIGTITPKPQVGNPVPRLFRLAEDEAVINRMGFNNKGQAAAHRRLRKVQGGGLIGVNIGANKDSIDRVADYALGVSAMANVASYLTVNISSPNTPGLRALQDGDALLELLDAVAGARAKDGPPIFLKVAPDLEPHEIETIARLAVGRVDALIVSNTTLSRDRLRSSFADQAGGMSGAPLRNLAQQRLIDFRKATGGALPLIGAGGIATAEDAYARIRAGASLVQLYSALVYHGPGLAREIVNGLKALLERDGFGHIDDVVGIDAG